MRAKQWRQGALAALLMLVAVWLVTLIWGLLDKAQIAVTQANDAKRQYEELEKRKATLKANVAALATERGKDSAIRTAFGVALPGEEVIVVVPPEAPTTTTKLPWWQVLLNWFR